MKTGNALQLSCYGLCLILTFIGHGTGQLLPEPPPVDCVYSSWSPWTACDPCALERVRSRAIEAFGQFKGQPCREPVGESQACTAESACVPPPTAACSPGDAPCGSGECIKKRLLCNYDFDCEDHTDEENCGRMARKACGSRTDDANDRGRSAMGQGINILGPSPPKKLFHNEYFGGACQMVSGMRTPWNVGVLNFETNTEKTISSTVYESNQRLVREVLSEASFVPGGLSFKSVPFLGKPGVNKTLEEISMKKNQRFVRVKGKVQSSTYKLRIRDHKMSESFLKDIQSLPVEYEKGSYFKFIEDYGTHYAKGGRLGGNYDLIYVLNVEEIKKRNLTDGQVLQCFKDVPSTASCTIFNKVVDKVIVSVKGGDPATVSAMERELETGGLLKMETYQTWVQSISSHPGLLYSEREPITNMMPFRVAGETKVPNVKRAIEDYVAEYSICKCRPCHNNGTLILVNGLCSCFCALGYQGLACQNYIADPEPHPSETRPSLPPPRGPRTGGIPGGRRPGVSPSPKPSPTEPRRPAVLHQGNWACWSGWSTCSADGKRSRSRVCNVEGLPLGGTCSGPDSESDWC